MIKGTKPRLAQDMDFKEILFFLTEDHPGAYNCLLLIFKATPMTAKSDLFLFDRLGIYGKYIHTLWNDCCSNDLNLLVLTLRSFREGKFTKQEVHEKLSSGLPFIQ